MAPDNEVNAHLGNPGRGRRLYKQRGQIIEPVFGQTKSCRGIDRFLQRGLGQCQVEWEVICGTHNLLKLWRSGKARHTARA